MIPIIFLIVGLILVFAFFNQDFFPNAINKWTILLWIIWLSGMVLMGLLISCDEARPQDNPPPIAKEEPAKPKEPDKQISDLFGKLDALRTGQIITLINQLCTEENGINEECGAAISKCFAERWAPVNKLLQCYREWKDSEKQEVKQ